MKQKLSIYWSRRDFRLSDNPALYAAVAHSKKEQIPFLPLFVLEDYMAAGNPKDLFGYPSRIFLTKALPRFSEHFSNFTVVEGKAAQSIISLSHSFDIVVFVNEDIHKDFYTQIKKLRDSGVQVKLYADGLSVSKDIKTGTGNIYSVFTPFKNAVWQEFCTKEVVPKVHVENVLEYTGHLGDLESKRITCTEENVQTIMSTTKTFCAGGVVYDVDNLLRGAATYHEWYVDEKSALAHFTAFLKNTIADYKKKRDYLATEGTSRMSLALAWGLVSARTLRQKIEKHYDVSFSNISSVQQHDGAVHYISELIWREFYKYLLYHYPELLDLEFQKKFQGTITWVDTDTAHYRFTKWIQGETGYPIVDAAMMELAKTGYMHNRARMIAASVLTKNFGVDWRWGQEYFRAMLIDLDDASNNGGWQWGASVGADPKPIRIFNPYLQAENYDADLQYQKKYLREDYATNPPEVLVEHAKARAEALIRYGLTHSKDTAVRDY